MVISEVRIRKVEVEGKLRAFASVTFDNVFVVHGLKVIEGANGMFVSMPNRKTSNGDFKDVAHPVSKEYKDILSEAVLAEFNKQ